MNYACDGMVQPSVSLFLMPTLPLLPSYIVIKNNFVFLKNIIFKHSEVIFKALKIN